jgi:RHS repeat-associated protein
VNRLTGSTHAGTGFATQSVSYAYDVPDTTTGCTASSPLGRLGTMTDPSGSTTYCYDAHGNTASKAQTIAGSTMTVSYGYTLGDRLASITYPGGAVIGYGRDAQGRINAMTQDGNPLVTAATYLPFGPLSGITFQGGATQAFAYDQNYAIDAITGTALNHDFSTDALGNIVALPHATAATARTFEYDALSRLLKVKDGAPSELEVFTYDATGNRLSKESKTATEAYDYPSDSHRLASIDFTARGYDAMGSLTDRGDGWSYVYDARQRLMEAHNGSSLEQINTYNGRGERVLKQPSAGVGGSLSLRYLYDESGRLIAEQSKSGILAAQLKQQVVWLEDRPVALMRTAYANETLQVHSDHLGTPRAVTRLAASNAVVWRWALTGTVFGEDAPEEDPDNDSTSLTVSLRFPGQYFDSESGLYYNYFRDYEKEAGRYVESDPVGLGGGVATYSYAEMQPLLRADRRGLWSFNSSCDWNQRVAVSSAMLDLLRENRRLCESDTNSCSLCDCKSARKAILFLLSATFRCDRPSKCAGMLPNGSVNLEAGVATGKKMGGCGCLAANLLHEGMHIVYSQDREDKTRIETRKCIGCASNQGQGGGPLPWTAPPDYGDYQ